MIRERSESTGVVFMDQDDQKDEGIQRDSLFVNTSLEVRKKANVLFPF